MNCQDIKPMEKIGPKFSLWLDQTSFRSRLVAVMTRISTET